MAQLRECGGDRHAPGEIQKAEIAAAVKAAKAFRDKLEGVGISYHKLLALEEARRDMNDLAHNILLGWENGEGFPHE